MDPLDTYVGWLARMARGSRAVILLTVALAPLILGAIVVLLVPVAAPMAGALAGAGLFAAAHGYWATHASTELRAATNLKARVPLPQRRVAVGAAVLLWAVALLLTGRFLPGPLLGTLNVFVAICLYRLWRPTEPEAAELRAYWTEREAERKAEREASDAQQSHAPEPDHENPERP